MFDLLIQIFLGWPAMIVSLTFALAGILLRKWALPLIGAILFIAPAWYLSNYLIVLGSPPFFLLLSAYAISRKKIPLAMMAVIPVVAVMGALGYVVLNQ